MFKVTSSVLMNTEYSVKIGQIFGNEYSAKVAETPNTEKTEKIAIFRQFLRNF